MLCSSDTQLAVVESYSFSVFNAFTVCIFQVTYQINSAVRTQWQLRDKFKSLDPVPQYWKQCSSPDKEHRAGRKAYIGWPSGSSSPVPCHQGKRVLSWLLWPWQRKHESRFPAGHRAAHWYGSGRLGAKRKGWALDVVCSGKRLAWFVLWD